MPEETKKYFGSKDYVGVEDTGLKTPSGVPIIKVLFADGTSEVTTQALFELLSGDVQLDFTQIRDLTIAVIIPKIFSILTDYNLKRDDVNTVADGIVNTYNATFDHALAHTMGVKNVGHIPLLTINKINDESRKETKE